MKETIAKIILSFMFFIPLFLHQSSGIAVPLNELQRPFGSIWPSFYCYKYSSSLQPTLMSSVEEAIAALKTLQPRMHCQTSIFQMDRGSSYGPGIPAWIPPYEIKVNNDTLSLRYKWTYKESGGLFTTSFPMDKARVIPLKDVRSLTSSESGFSVNIRLKRTSEAEGEAIYPENWGGTRNKIIIFFTQNQKDMKLLLDSIYTLCYPYGFRNQFSNLSFGLDDLTDAQKKEVGVPGGVLVTGVSKDRSAAEAGMKFLDIIRECNGMEITDLEQFWELLKSCPAQSGTTLKMKILRWAEYKEKPKDNLMLVQDINASKNKEEILVEMKWE